jgi:hypothetical protein
MRDWLKHAFAVDRGAHELTPEQRAAAERVCREIVRRHLTTPALAFLEMSRPLNYLGAQALHFFSPFIGALTDAEGHRHFAAFLERRSAVEYLCRRIEELEAESQRRVEDAASVRDGPPQL